MKIKRVDGFERNGESALEVHASGSWFKHLRSSSMPTRLSLGSLSLVWDLTMKKGVSLPYTNWSRAEVAFLDEPETGRNQST